MGQYQRKNTHCQRPGCNVPLNKHQHKWCSTQCEKLATDADRKAYQRAYYLAHRDQALDYQKEYQRRWRNKRGIISRDKARRLSRPRRVTDIHAATIQSMTTTKAIDAINDILRGRVTYARVGHAAEEQTHREPEVQDGVVWLETAR